MHKTFTLPLLLACAAITLPAAAAVVATTGAGSATPSAAHLAYTASFEGNTGLSNSWAEGGLNFTQVNALAADNGGCGYAGVDCADPAAGLFFSEAFEGNFFKTAGFNAYLSIKSASTVLHGIEFAADSGYATIYLMWQTWLDGVQTGTGKLSLGTGGVGDVLGLSDLAGFNEVRVYAFDSASDNSGFSAAAIDSVRGFTVPEPGSLGLAGAAALGLLGVRRRRG